MARNLSALGSLPAAGFPLDRPVALKATAPGMVNGKFVEGWPAWLDATPLVTIVADLKGRVCFINAEGRTMLGAATTEALLTGLPLSEAFVGESGQLVSEKGVPTALATGVWHGEGVLLNHLGRETPMALTISARAPAEAWLVCVACDISNQKKRERRLEHLATHDALTGLPNLALFRDRLARELHLVRRNIRPFAVLFVDVDRFKDINDHIGHEGANRVLAEVAVRLYSCVRAIDTVARYGGDEFAIILTNLNDAAESEFVIRRICASTSKPFSVLGSELAVNVSIGVATFPADASTAEGLLVHADRSMYRCKREARNATVAGQSSFAERQRASAASSLRRH